MIRHYRYRLYPTPTQDKAMRWTCELLRDLYNAALQERRDSHAKTGKSPSCYEQQKCLREVRYLRPEFAEIHWHMLVDVMVRLDRAYKAFFRRCKAGATPGYPRFKGRGRYTSFTLQDAGNGIGAKLCSGNKRLRISGIGNVKIKLHRPHEGRLKQVTISLNSDGHWYASFVCDNVPTKPLPSTGKSVGIDVGLTTFATFSDEQTPVENPRLMKHAQAALATAQRVAAKRKRGSKRRRKAVALLAKQHAHVRNARRDFHHKTALSIVREYDSISVEKLNVKGLASGMLAKSVRDVGWGQFLSILAAKAEEAGREFNEVNPAGTTRDCSACGEPVPKGLGDRIHDCPKCGIVLCRDKNAARNIERLGRSLRREMAARGPL